MVLTRFCLLLVVSLLTSKAASLRLELDHRYGKSPLTLNSLRYPGAETFAVSRLSYLLSAFEIQSREGKWHSLEPQYGFIDQASRKTSFTLKNIPEGRYQAIRFGLGVPPAINHADPAQFGASHPLNPNLNRLHWDWTGGYIFLALEGTFQTKLKDQEGFVYHLATDDFFSKITIPAQFDLKTHTALSLRFDLQKLLSGNQPLSFISDGNATHSHPGDPIAEALVANLQTAFSHHATSYPPLERPLPAVKPLHLPDSYTAFPFKTSRRFPIPSLPRDNPLLEERVSLGKMLFHDKGLSRNETISCATCHQETRAFTDGLALSKGIENRLGDRNSMPLFNLAWKSSFFWDGRAKSLREQVLEPIADHHEMDSSLPQVIARLEVTSRPAFEKAFGPGPVTSEKIALALENYLLTLTSYDSKFDRAAAGKAKLSVSEERGMKLFFTEYDPRTQQYGADCFHCHGGANFSDHQRHDNGFSNGRHTSPSLRNLAYTAPYGHDGRFETLAEVIAHYSGPIPRTDELDPNLKKHPKEGLQLTKGDQQALVDFLNTLNDPKYQGFETKISD